MNVEKRHDHPMREVRREDSESREMKSVEEGASGKTQNVNYVKISEIDANAPKRLISQSW